MQLLQGEEVIVGLGYNNNICLSMELIKYEAALISPEDVS